MNPGPKAVTREVSGWVWAWVGSLCREDPGEGTRALQGTGWAGGRHGHSETRKCSHAHTEECRARAVGTLVVACAGCLQGL